MADPQDTIAARFAAQAALAPAAPAVRHRGRAQAYGQLAAATAAVAADLAWHGIAAGSAVGIRLERSPEAVAAVLGTLAAGCAYVPLDPDWPGERLAVMARRAGVSAVITPDGCARTAEGGPVPAAAAYIAFTSGSSGGPKPVAVSHAQALAMYAAWEKAYDLSDIRVHLQMAGFGFDVWTGDMLRALLSGGELVICPREVTLDPPALYRLLRETGAQCAEFVPATFMPLARHLAATGQDLGFMKLVVVGSDRWTGRDYALARSVAGGALVVNSYGTTETTIDATCWTGDGPLPDPGRMVPIGWPLPGVEAYVTDDDLLLVPDGEPGELVIGGAGVSCGYPGDPEATAAKFVPDPFSGLPGARVYRTGDIARWGPDGLELLGRRDEQVQVAGARVEPAEVEAVLAACPGVTAAAVVARDWQGTARLAGYVTPVSADPAAVRGHVAAYLPPYAVPAVYPVDGLPLNAAGKVDRRALRDRPFPGGGQADGDVAAIWRDILGTSPGPGDNFFALGGTSVLAAGAVTRLRAVTGVPVPLWVMWETATLGDLETWLRHAKAQARPARRHATRSRAADVVVTGGTGGAGGFVVRFLIRRGYPVTVTGRDESAGAVPGGAAFIPADLLDTAALKAIARDAAGIVHAACTFTHPETDIAAMEALVSGWRRGPFVLISTTDVYGTPHQGVVTEDTRPAPGRSPYAEGKAACEAILAAAAGGRPYAILRPAHVWGPHPVFRSQLMHGDLAWLSRPLAAGLPVKVPAGGDAWIDARDLARATAAALTRPPSQPVNVIAGHFTWPDLAAVLAGLLGSPSVITPAAGSGWTYSAGRLRDVLGVTRLRRDYAQALAATLNREGPRP